ncbi:hypothetical protein [Bradyrhizobium cenepequi]
MTKRLPFTEFSLARAIRGVQRAGLFVVGVKPDGTLIVSDKPLDTASLVPVKGTSSVDSLEAARAASWDDFRDAPASKWEDKRADDRNMRSFGERLGGQHRDVNPESNPLAAAFDRLMRGEITLDQLPPGRYPNGMRVYADGEWETIVRSRPLGKREVAALKAYAEADGLPNFLNSGPDTNERLEIRGIIEKSDVPRDGRMPHYRITEAGKAEWLRLTNNSSS